MKIEQYHLHKEHPEKLQFQIYDLESYLKESGVHAQKPHSHSFYQIIWIYNQGGVHYVDFDAFKVENQTVLFVSKNQIHYFDKEASHEGVIIHFNESFLSQSDIDIFLKYNVFNNISRPFQYLNQNTIELATTYHDLIKDEFSKHNAFGYQEVIRYLLKSLLIVFERAHTDVEKISEAHNSQYKLMFLRFKELIEMHYQEHYSVKDYARVLNMSSKTLSVLTKEISNKTPSVLISERLILEAERLLAFTSLQVNEIAYRLGFEDASYFIKYFKRHLKKSPKVYREMRL
ncbi:AraC family transcriptional regulator [uncultured Algibacter sp.]|uniref:helix-turn-helix domain-containing protein n=1 Tax=uncultured Algibacter sp. TaxID=298659 RepID=UPI00263970B9|nr:helix-turn-helix domain-containing protein [uncultured Algibacter sp.]